MYINEETAQLILDALAWSNKDWMDSLNWDNGDEVDNAHVDFIRFCRARGIAGVERRIDQWVYDKCAHDEEVEE